MEIQCAKKKLGCKCNFVDEEARNGFKSNEVTPSIIKYAHGCNHCGLRDLTMNNNIVDTCCLEQRRETMWSNVLK